MAEGKPVIAKLAWIGGSLLTLVAALLLAPFLLPLDRFLPEVSARAASALGQPVAIDAIALRLLPSPRAALSGLRIGKDKDVEIADLMVIPALLSLLGQRTVIDEVRAERVRVKEGALAWIGAPRESGGGAGAVVRRVVLREVTLEHSAISLPEFDLSARLRDDQQLEDARFETRDGSLRVHLDPQDGGATRLDLEAKKWKLPAGPPLVLDSLRAQGLLRGKTLDVPKLDGTLYGGKLAGGLKLDWDKRASLNGSFDMANIDIAAVQAAMGRAPVLSGRLEAKGGFTANAKSPDQLAAAVSLDSPFKVNQGVLHGFDLSQAANVLTGRISGGQTRFDELRGNLAVRGKRVRVNGLCAKSAVLTAGGFVEKHADERLSGRLDVSVSGSKGWVGVPVALGGSTANPSVTPTRGATIGAVVGTVLLPGIGTALGARAGTATEKRSDCG